MNIAMEQTEEYVNGQLKAKYGDAFIRGNNGATTRAHRHTQHTDTHTHTRTYGPAAAPDHRSACGRSLVHFHNKTQGLMRPPFAGLALAARCTSMSPLVSACTVRPVPSRVVLGSGPSIIGLPYRTCFLFFCVFLFREAACSSATPPRARARGACVSRCPVSDLSSGVCDCVRDRVCRGAEGPRGAASQTHAHKRRKATQSQKTRSYNFNGGRTAGRGRRPPARLAPPVPLYSFSHTELYAMIVRRERRASVGHTISHHPPPAARAQAGMVPVRSMPIWSAPRPGLTVCSCLRAPCAPCHLSAGHANHETRDTAQAASEHASEPWSARRARRPA